MARIIAERWSPCPEGEFDRLEASLRARAFRHTLFVVVMALAAALAVAAASYSVADAYWPSANTGVATDCVPCAPPALEPLIPK